MALRIGGARRMPVEEELPAEELPVEEMEEEILMEDPEAEILGDDMAPAEESAEMGMVDPMVAGYMGPEQGPFTCSNCIHFSEDGACELVKGPIDPEGSCNLFESMTAAQEQPMEEGLEEEPVLEEELEESEPLME